MQIGEIANATGLSRDTLRFYEKRGLLRARRSANGYRDYPPEAVEWLRYLRLAQSLGFTLAEIEADLPLLAAPDASRCVSSAMIPPQAPASPKSKRRVAAVTSASRMRLSPTRMVSSPLSARRTTSA